MKLKTTMVCAVLGVMLSMAAAEQASAATVRYRQSGDYFTSADPTGWTLNGTTTYSGTPGAGDTGRINFGDNTVTLAGAAPSIGRLQIGVDESGTLEINSGGSLSSVTGTGGENGDVLAGNNNAAATGTLRVNSGGTLNVGRILWAANGGSTGVIDINAGGQVNVASHLWLGASGAATISIGGTLTQTGGILGLGTTNASTASGGTAAVTIEDGGLLALNNIAGSGNSVQAGSIINLAGTGQLTVPGDFFDVLTDNYVNVGKISGGSSSLVVDLTTNPGFTTVSVAAVPEPTSAALLLGLGVTGMCARRRRKS